MEEIPVIDLKKQYQSIRPELDAVFARVLEKGSFILGSEVSTFEKEFAEYCGVAHAIGVASGTEALQLALMACEVGKPADAGDAAAMLRTLSGRTHEVITAVSLVSAAREAQAVSASQVTVAALDDAAQGVTDVVRGADLLDSTARQVLLQRALGLPMPRYAHLPLLLGEDGRKLSKSDAALPVDAADPLPSLHMLWTCLGQPPLPAEADAGVPAFLQHAIAGFRLDRVPRRAQAASAAVHNTPATSRD